MACSLILEKINILTAFQRIALISYHFKLSRMTAIRMTGKGLFALRKTIKLAGDIELLLERDPDNLKGGE